MNKINTLKKYQGKSHTRGIPICIIRNIMYTKNEGGNPIKISIYYNNSEPTLTHVVEQLSYEFLRGIVGRLQIFETYISFICRNLFLKKSIIVV